MTTLNVLDSCKPPPGSAFSLEVSPRYIDVSLSYTYTGKITTELTQIITSKDAERCFRSMYQPGKIALQESFHFMILNRANRLLALIHLSTGGTTGTVCDIKLMLIYLIAFNSHSVIICHNHPSGNLNPSDADRQFTIKFKAACSLVDIRLMDHVIISPDEGAYYSLSDNGDI